MIRLIFRRIRHWLLWPLIVILTVLFCILFTIPGNQLIAWTANQFVPGLNIRLGETRFYDDKPFSVSYQQGETQLALHDISLNLNWYCRGICIDSLKVKQVQLILGDVKPSDEVATPLSTLVVGSENVLMTLPLRFILTRFEMAELEVQLGLHQHLSARNVRLSIEGEQSQIALHALKVDSVHFNDQRIAAVEPKVALTELPPLPRFEIYSPVNLIIDEILIGKVTLTQQQTSQVIEEIKLSARLFGSELNITQLSANSNGAALAVNGQAQLAQQNTVALTSNVSYQQEQTELKLEGPLNALHIMLTNKGIYPFDLSGNIDLWSTNFPFNLNAQLANWQLVNNTDTIALHQVKLALNGDANDYVIDLQASSQFNAFSAISSQLHAKGGLTQLNVISAMLSSAKSQLQLSSMIKWADGLNVEAKADIKQLDMSEISTAYRSNLNGNLAFSLHQQGQGWQVKLPSLQLQGDVNDIPLTLKGQLSLDDEFNGVIKTLQLNSGENFVKLAGKINQNWDLNGQLKLSNAVQISPSLSGVANADFSIKGKRATPIANWQLAINGLTLPQVVIENITSVGKLDVANQFDTQMSLSAANIIAFDKTLRSLTFDAKGNKTKQTANLQLDSDWLTSGFSLASSLDGELWQGALTDFFISDNVKRFTVDQPLAFALNWQKQAINLAPHCWLSHYSKLCVERLALDPQNGDVGLRLAEFNLHSIDHLLPAELVAKGIFTGAVDAQWQQRALSRLVAKLTSSEFALTLHQGEQQFVLPFEQSEINVQADATTAQLDLLLESALLGQLKSELVVSDLANQRALLGSLSLSETQLVNFKPFLKQFEQLSGAVKANVNIAGTLQAPQLTGQIEATEIVLSGAQLPIALKETNLALVFDQQQALLQGNLKDSNGGFADIHGLLNWQHADLLASLDIKGEQISLKPQTGVKVKLSPDLKLTYEDQLLNIEGQVVLPYGRIKMKSLPVGAVQVSDDEVIVDAKIKSKKALPFNYLMNVALVVKDDVIIDSFGLYSKLAGQLTLKKAQNTPLLVVGDMNLIDGNYQAFSQDLLIKTGQIGFNGAIDKPYLNIKAIRNPATTADGVIAGIKLSGPIETPQLEIFSEPSMDQAMALSYLLNGRPIGDGDRSNDGLLTQMLITQGLSRSQGMVNKIGKAFGVQDIALASKGSGDETKVEISGYLLPGVQVRYSIGIFDSITEIAVRYQIMPQLYIEATNGLNNALDILYKFDWD